MARYIDIEKRMEQWGHLCDSYFPNLPCQRFEDFITDAPTADVVPKSEYDILADELERTRSLVDNLRDDVREAKSEVERLKKDNEYILMQHRFQRRPSGDCWNDVIEKAKTEVAREIFEEIEKYVEVALMNGHIETPILCIGHSTFAELKKKYTGENEHG